MSRFERRLYVVLAVVILVWPGVRRQFFQQIRQITHTTDVRVGSWPKFTTSWFEPNLVPMKKLERVARKHGLWEGLAELQNAEGRYGNRETDTTAVTRSFEKALVAEPDSKVVHARYLPLHLRQIDFYRPEEREFDERKLGRRLEAYPSAVTPQQAKPALDFVVAGQKLDPQNSYYDYALTLIYVGLHRDDEAIAAANRGWRKPVFNTYYKEAALNVRQLRMEAGVPGLEANNDSASSFSYLARMRRLAVTLTRIGQKAESDGDWKRGWEFRLAAFRIGNQLIRGEQQYIDGLVGTAIQVLAMGELPKTAEQRRQLVANKDRDAQGRVLTQVLKDYIAKHEPREGRWVVSQYIAGQEYRRGILDLFAKDQGSIYRFQLSKLMWFGSESLLAEVLALWIILGILSLPRTIRMAESGRASKIVGRIGASLTIIGIVGVGYYAVRIWSHGETTIPAGLTWGLIGLLPALIIIFALARRRPSLASIRASARYALPVIAIAYIVLSGVLAIERGSFEKRALQSIEHGLDPQQIEILKKTGFRR